MRNLGKLPLLEMLESALRTKTRKVYFGMAAVEPPRGAYVQPVSRFNFVLSGHRSALLPIDGKIQRVDFEEGDVQISAPNSWETPIIEQPHELLCLVPRKSHFRLAAHIYEAADGGKLATFGGHYHTAQPVSDVLRNVCLALVGMSKRQDPQSTEHLLNALKSLTLRECRESNEEAHGHRRAELLFKQMQNWVENHFQESISRETLAEYFGVSPSYVSRLYRQMTGATFVEALARERINFAKTLLQETDLAVFQIADQCGFANTAYFVKCFREMCGISPAKFRKALFGKVGSDTSA